MHQVPDDVYSQIELTKIRYDVTRGPFSALNERHLQFFKEILDAEQVLTNEEDLKKYNIDWFLQHKGSSTVVLKPKTTVEVSQILAYCNDQRLAVCPQGGRTGVSAASLSVFDEIILSAELLNKVIDFDELSGTIVCESGCIMENVQKYLQDTDLILPVDLASRGSCQIGGNVSTNAGGFRFARFGSLHGNVLGLEVVKANGDVLDCLKTLRKDNTGYHLKNLFIGSEGTLGFITKVALQCLPRPKSIQVAFLGLQSYEKVLKTHRLAKQMLGEILSAVEFMDATAVRLVYEEMNVPSPIGDYPFYLLIETYGSNEDHDSDKMNNFFEAALSQNFILNGIIASKPSERQAIWKIRELAPKAGRTLGHLFTYDVTLPLKDYYAILEIMKGHMGEKARAISGLGHLGDGNLHLHITVDKYTNEIREYIESFLYKKVIELNGSISAEHGLGFSKAKYLKLARSDLYIDTMKNMKKMMDPNGILNPYKVLTSCQ